MTLRPAIRYYGPIYRLSRIRFPHLDHQRLTLLMASHFLTGPIVT
jgi:hypothetical protein